MKKNRLFKLPIWQKALLTLAILYSFYLIKSGLGINISDQYHLADIFTRPKALVKAAVHRLSKNQVTLPPALIPELTQK
ncbi:MAG: hypothetical protein HC916_13685 [Coleofasciculaceae cyanobacterium SM2_1_6]|nr:hypothetical protein [Coleofasciculaceae cyanobacterium SM2_1_6]